MNETAAPASDLPTEKENSATPNPQNDRFRLDRRRVRNLTTPEGVDLSLTLASAGERVTAFMIDALIMLTTLIVFMLVCFYALEPFDFGNTNDIVFIIWLLGFFLLRNFYFFAFEMGPRAATPGKRIVGLRVINRTGDRLAAESIFARNAMREVEVYLPFAFSFPRPGIDGWIALFGFIWGLAFLLMPLFNKDHLRAGDLIGGTWVIKAPKLKLKQDLAAQGEAQLSAGLSFTREELDVYGEKELHVLRRVIDGENTSDRRKVADQIRKKVGRSRDRGYTDRDFLVAYYAALRQRLEDRMVMGQRRHDKHHDGLSNQSQN